MGSLNAMPAAVVAIGLAVSAIVLAVQRRWHRRTHALVARCAVDLRAPPDTFQACDLSALPAPVQRYFRLALRDGQSCIRRAAFEQAGDFLVDPRANRWAPFIARQVVGVGPASFVWDARIRMAPMLNVWVRDAFADGAGQMRAAMLAVLPVVEVADTPAIAKASLQRYLAEAAWLPTALLPSAGVRWSPIDAMSARATLECAGVCAVLDFRFGADGLIESVLAPDRARHIDGHDVPTPWQGRWYDYETQAGMRIPMRGEVEWLLPEGPQVYWKGRLTRIEFA